MDDRDETIDRLRTKVGERTRDADLLQAKIERLEVGGGLEAGRGAIIRSGDRMKAEKARSAAKR